MASFHPQQLNPRYNTRRRVLKSWRRHKKATGLDGHVELLEEQECPCWCGEQNPYCSDEPYNRGCGGTGTLICYCGGDQCVCHNHGEVECFGCEDCSQDERYLDEDEDGSENQLHGDI